MEQIDIFITSFYRKEFTKESVRLIRERTEPETYRIHVFDNGSDVDTQDFLISLLRNGEIVSLHLDSRNTGCLYNKGIFHMSALDTSEFYIVTDNDVYPPRLEPDWLSQMLRIMKKNPDLGMLAPQLPPQFLQGPLRVENDLVYCKAVGNTLKLVRKAAFPIYSFKSILGAYGDDGMVSSQMRQSGWEVAFCRNIFCFHSGQCDNWGYTEEQIGRDPRKSGYGPPFRYELVDEETYEPEPRYRM